MTSTEQLGALAVIAQEAEQAAKEAYQAAKEAAGRAEQLYATAVAAEHGYREGETFGQGDDRVLVSKVGYEWDGHRVPRVYVRGWNATRDGQPVHATRRTLVTLTAIGAQL